jgi:hypothetical protein
MTTQTDRTRRSFVMDEAVAIGRQFIVVGAGDCLYAFTLAR